MQNGQYRLKKVPLMKNLQFLSKFNETLLKGPKHELVKLAKFHQISTKIEHFSLIELSGVCIVRFASVSRKQKLVCCVQTCTRLKHGLLICFICYLLCNFRSLLFKSVVHYAKTRLFSRKLIKSNKYANEFD